jgi:hypothetical protein
LIEQVIGRYMWREHLNDSQLSALENAGFEMHSCSRYSVKIFHKDIKSPLVSWQYNRTIGSKFSWRKGSASYQEQLKRILQAVEVGNYYESPAGHALWVVKKELPNGDLELESVAYPDTENIVRSAQAMQHFSPAEAPQKKNEIVGTEAHTLVIDDADYLAETAVMQAQSLQAELNEANSERMGNHLTEELREQMNEIKEQSFLKIFLKQSENTMANSPMNTMDAREAVKGSGVAKEPSLRIKKVTYFGGKDITSLDEDDLIFGIEHLGAEKETLLSAMKGVKSKRVTKKIEEIEDTIEQLVSLLDALED